jgi:hypothetical protein
MAVSADLLKSIRNKFSTYTLDQCNYAKADITNTLQYHREGEYAEKLWAEIDAANDRIAELKAKGRKRRLHTKEIMELLEKLQSDCEFVSKHDFGLPLYIEGQKLLIASVRDWWNKLPE